ncbi:hypothetical protein D8T55_20705 [Vibrio vulnificus]|nr:hypothetical protein D8T55_20705 [Vibrio vulnificus]
MFSHVRLVGCIFSLFLRISNFGLVGKLSLVVAVFWTPIRGRSCLIEIQSVGEVSEVILISKLKPRFFGF